MAYGERRQRVSTDRFGNPYQLIGCKPNKNGYPVGYVKLKGQLYKLEPSDSKKEGVENWIKVTAIKEQARHSSM